MDRYQDYDFVVDDGEQEYADPEHYVDQFYQQMEFEAEDGEGGLSPFSLTEILEHCIQPTVTDGLGYMSKILLWSFIFRICTQTVDTPIWTKHAASIISGTILASNFFSDSVFYLLVLTTLGYLLLLTSPGFRGPTAALFIVAFNIGCELWVAEAVSWHQVRGAVMICSMKVISVGFDLDSAERKEILAEVAGADLRDKKLRSTTNNGLRSRGKRRSETEKEKEKEETAKPSEETLSIMPGWFEFAGYCLCPGTVVLGPWIPFQDYKNIFINPRWNLNWLVKIGFTVFFAFMFLSISTCWNPWLIPDSSWRWWLAYRDAMSFRASHYFVSFMSEASAITAGLGATKVGLNTLWQLQVTQPHNIEVPRSLVEVVVSWNLPMHAWLKKYVFRQARKNFGSGVAVMATYGASCLLHGLSAQLSAVLLSLGLYTWVEHSFRLKLARIMNASIETRRDTDSKYSNREGSAWVILVNLMFGLLAMFHLAYLGVMFDQSDSGETGYSWTHTLSKWRNLSFCSHYVVGAMVVLNWII